MTSFPACGRSARRLILLILTVCLTGSSRAQPRYGAGPEIRQAAGFSFSKPSFEPTSVSCAVQSPEGECLEFVDFVFENPILGLFYSRPGIQLFIGRGVQGGNDAIGDLELLDTSINVFGVVRPFPDSREGAVRFIFPYGLHSGYRRLSSSGSNISTDQFEATVISAGAGIGAMRLEGKTRFTARVMPHFGLASRSLGFGNGTSTHVDADLDVTIGPLSGRIGIAMGYQFRWQRWKMDEDFADDRSFKGTMHGFRLGIFW